MRGEKMSINEKKMQIVIDNYFKSECNVDTSIRDAFEKGFCIGVKKTANKFVTAQENTKEMNERCKTIETAREFAKTKYVLFKGDEYHVFDTEKDACEFLGVKKCSVAGAWRDKGKCKGWNVIRIGNGADMRGEEENDK